MVDARGASRLPRLLRPFDDGLPREVAGERPVATVNGLDDSEDVGGAHLNHHPAGGFLARRFAFARDALALTVASGESDTVFHVMRRTTGTGTGSVALFCCSPRKSASRSGSSNPVGTRTTGVRDG